MDRHLDDELKELNKQLLQMAALAEESIYKAIDALKNQDKDKAQDIINRELIYDYIVKDGLTAPRAVPLLLIARHLERICDHATNIAEDVIYMVSAEVVKHHPEKLKN